MIARLVSIMCLVFGAVGCFGTDTGNPPVAASLLVRSSDPMVVVAPASAEVVIERAWISIGDVRAVLGDACDHVSASYDTDVVGEVIDGIVLTGLPAGRTCGVHLVPAVVLEVPVAAPEGLLDRSFFVEGRLADGTPFELSTEHAAGLDVIASSGFDLVEGAGVLVVFDVARWVAGLDLASIPIGADGVARVGPGTPDIAAFGAGFVGSVELYLDAGGDGAFGPAEVAAGPIAQSHAP